MVRQAKAAIPLLRSAFAFSYTTGICGISGQTRSASDIRSAQSLTLSAYELINTLQKSRALEQWTHAGYACSWPLLLLHAPAPRSRG